MNGALKINTEQVIGKAQELSGSAAQIRNIAQQIIACKNQLRINTGSSALLKLRISQLYDRALDNAAQMDTLKEALEEIVRMYDACETGIVNHALGISAEDRDNANESAEPEGEGTDKRSWWRRFLDWVLNRDTDTRYTHTTPEQEAAADAEMQRQIQELTNSDRFSEETWANATPDERRAILQEYLIEVAAILGIDINTVIDFTPRAPSNGFITNGSYSHGSESVYINGYIIDNYSAERSYELMTTVVHELRHAYQHAAVDNPADYQVSQETIDRWSESFDNYRNTSGFEAEGMSPDEAYEAYRNQDVEVDARWFAGQD